MTFLSMSISVCPLLLKGYESFDLGPTLIQYCLIISAKDPISNFWDGHQFLEDTVHSALGLSMLNTQHKRQLFCRIRGQKLQNDYQPATYGV